MTPGTDWPALVARKWNGGLDPALNLSGRSHLGYQTAQPAPYTARVTLKEACELRGLSVYQVAMSGHAQGTVDSGTVYRLARGDTSRIDLHTLATLAGILHTLTGQPVTVGELLALEAVNAVES
ncbi:helix-turn-helix domain-containing protein [Deinococcus altitudinis]|uniref:helix-turn-helix domain-containing protein n=1 Tax=Deinococcus altitudinis TaxID=468914 RepID=UPI0038920CE3